MIGRTPILGKELVIFRIFLFLEPISSLWAARSRLASSCLARRPHSGFTRNR
jgi:hypothetical protein